MAIRKPKKKPEDWAKLFSKFGRLGVDIERAFNEGYSVNGNAPKRPGSRPRTPHTPPNP
jgi:hypothetical protein